MVCLCIMHTLLYIIKHYIRCLLSSCFKVFIKIFISSESKLSPNTWSVSYRNFSCITPSQQLLCYKETKMAGKKYKFSQLLPMILWETSSIKTWSKYKWRGYPCWEHHTSLVFAFLYTHLCRVCVKRFLSEQQAPRAKRKREFLSVPDPGSVAKKDLSLKIKCNLCVFD